jgi:eukaryotic-like serine/threonine-protein kinase
LLGPPRKPGHLGSLGALEVHEVIGEGGMGIVCKARYDSSAPLPREVAASAAATDWVAVKLLRPELMNDPRAREYFEHEPRRQMRLRHPNIIPILQVGEYRGCPFYVMPRLSGGSLAEKLA